MNEDNSDDSPPRGKRRIDLSVKSSAVFESDSDDITASRPRKKKLRVISDDDDTSDSSGSSVCTASRRRRILPKLRDSDVESEPAARSSPTKATSGFASDSSEGNSDKCSICLLRYTNQEIGTPVNCDHIFCLDCITEWSKNVNTCPVDRITFESIVVRACMGGRVLRTEAVKVTERRPSIELLVIEDPTVCEVPIEYWLCPDCTEISNEINSSRVDPLINRSLRRSMRVQDVVNQPSTSGSTDRNTARRGRATTTSRNTATTQSGSSNSSRQHTTHTRKQNKKSRNVAIEYEEEDDSSSVTRRVTKTVKRKKKQRKRQPRTAARRSHVQASVRARLAAMKVDRASSSHTAHSRATADLPTVRERAGIARLSLFGNDTPLEYFSDDDDAQVPNYPSRPVAVGPGSLYGTAVAFRQPHILDAYRRMRRKTVNISSPLHASTPPDIVSNIMESQSLFHAKNTVITVTPSGDLNIQKANKPVSHKKASETKKDERLDLSNAEDDSRKVPSYPGQSRGGGWGGGYRGTYNRDQNTNNFSRGGSYGGGYQNRQGQAQNNNGMFNYQNSNRHDEPDFYDNFSRRPHQYTPAEDPYLDRSRRPAPNDVNRTSNQSRYSLGPTWQPYGNAPPVSRQEMPPATARHSFGGFENPLDMRMGQMPTMSSNTDLYAREPQPEHDKHRQQLYNQSANTQPFQPLPEPPAFPFQKTLEVEKSEDEKSDSGLVIDTEKYDPTEPTLDDEDSTEEQRDSSNLNTDNNVVSEVDKKPAQIASSMHLPSLVNIAPAETVDSILAGINTDNINVPSNVLDSAVRQVLKKHRNLYIASNESQIEQSDNDSDGDCPNFSIYSATSVHIANNSSSLTEELEPKQDPIPSGLEDLVQEDDDVPTSESASPNIADSDITESVIKVEEPQIISKNNEFTEKHRINEEYKEKVSKRCPITTSTRNPIKIKLNTPSLIKRQVSLYDEEDTSQDIDVPTSDITTVDKTENPSILKSEKIINKDGSDKSEETVSSGKNQAILEDVEQFIPEIIKSPKSKVETVEFLENDISKDDKSEAKDDHEINEANTGEVLNQDSQEISDSEICLNLDLPKKSDENNEIEDNLEKMTESISETEDERSYTPCLDENKPKDNSFDTDKDKGIEGLDTEMISEDEGNELFSESERPASAASRVTSPPPAPEVHDDVEVPEKKKSERKKEGRDEVKKKKKKDSKKEGKEKNKSKKKGEVAFKKLSKSGKERNYREREKDDKKNKKDRRSSSEPEGKSKKRKEKRKDLERYDVRNVVTEKRRKTKDPFGRDISPRVRSPTLSPERRSPTASLERKSPRRRRSPSPVRIRRSVSRGRHSINRARRSLSRARRSISRARRSMSRVRRSPVLRRMSPVRRSRRSNSPRSLTPRISPRASPSPRRRSPARKRRRRSTSRVRKRRSTSVSPRRVSKKKKRNRSEQSPARRRLVKSPLRKSRSLSVARALPSPSVLRRLVLPLYFEIPTCEIHGHTIAAELFASSVTSQCQDLCTLQDKRISDIIRPPDVHDVSKAFEMKF
ncbi:unnamed protein product [Leptidea sinapis]|uniref:RING-type domain-containing protein n=1 Tax=Leptidea sinapis TaxID=189913 RepID=A0A5E4PSM6_9NEOP|nr:unnamed protein product [Leptidea sinapis]